jgi:hypothetical protein
MDLATRIKNAEAVPANADRAIILKKPGEWWIILRLASGTGAHIATFPDREFNYRLLTETALRACELRAPTPCVVTLDMTPAAHGKLANWNLDPAIVNAPFDRDVDNLDELRAEASA